MQTSPKGIKAIEIEEAIVLRAYQDIADVWTIGAGLTAASGVVTPKAGMQITRDEARHLLEQALIKNYEPAVRAALHSPLQHEFDAAVSFHWNTGAIGYASWVSVFNQAVRDWARIEVQFKSWNKAKVKRSRIVVKGLVNRRNNEFRMLRYGLYPTVPGATPRGLANFTHAASQGQVDAIRRGLSRLGFDPGPQSDGISIAAIKAFQEVNNLRVDGIIGPATLNTLQRVLDGRDPVLLRLLRSLL